MCFEVDMVEEVVCAVGQRTHYKLFRLVVKFSDINIERLQLKFFRVENTFTRYESLDLIKVRNSLLEESLLAWV